MARPDGRSLRTHLAATLPTQLIPASFVWLDALPRTSSGKIDRKALPHARGIALEPVEHIGGEARNNVEQAALEIWRDWFKDDRIGVCDNYFDLGGDSLDAFWLISKCNKRFGTSLPLSSLFTHPTVEHLALAIGEALTGGGGKKQQRKSGSDTRPLLVLMPGAAGDNRTLVRFRGALEEKLRFLVIEYPSWLDMVDAKGSLDAIVDSAIGQIRAMVGKDTCFLAGYSFGGVVAYEVASRLTRSGHPVGFLGLIDTKLSSQSPKLPVIEQGIQRWRMNRGVVGRLQMIILALLRFRAFSLLRIFSRLLMSLPLRLTADFHTMLVTQLQRHARMDWVPDPLQTPTVLFRAGEDAHEKERDYGWSQVCERLKIVPIGGDHVSILTPPDAEILQASLLAEVQEAYSNAQSTVGVAVPQ
jgi:thioesterase domain-containing protein/acyl carrier protein